MATDHHVPLSEPQGGERRQNEISIHGFVGPPSLLLLQRYQLPRAPPTSPDPFAPFRPRFEGLASDEGSTRLKASHAILSGLKDGTPAVIERVLDRLLVGLISGRKSARVGFSVTLTEVRPSAPWSFVRRIG